MLIYIMIETKTIKSNMVSEGDTMVAGEHCAYAFIEGMQVAQVVSKVSDAVPEHAVLP